MTEGRKMKHTHLDQFTFLIIVVKFVLNCESSVTENRFCSVPHCPVEIWKNHARPSRIFPSRGIADKRSGSVDNDLLGSINDIDKRLATTLDNLRQKIQPTIKSVENDIFGTNVNSMILALSNGLGGFYGALAGAGGLYNLNEISGGSKMQVLAQVMYGYGYSSPWSWKYQDPRIHCGRREFERVIEEYGFLNSPEEYLNVDQNVFSFYVSEFLQKAKLEMNCLVSKSGSNQDAKEFSALLDLYSMLLLEKINNAYTTASIVKRSGGRRKRSGGRRKRFESNKNEKLQLILNKIKDQIPKSIKSVESDLFESNVNNMILSISNGLGAVFGALAGTGGFFNLNGLTGGSKMQVLAQMMYGYGYSRPYQDNYKSPRLHCGLRDLEEVLVEYEFLTNPQPGLSDSVLEFYVEEMNKEIRRRLFCVISNGGTNQEARELDALIDLFTDTLSSSS